MSPTYKASLTRLGVLALGMVTWYAAGKTLRASGAYDRDSNILTLKGSPFGKTIAMAMQGPIDVYWHEGEAHDHVHVAGESCSECDHPPESPAADPAAEEAEGSQVAVSTGGLDQEVSRHERCAVEACAHNHPADPGHRHAPGESCEGCGHDTPGLVAVAEETGSLTSSVRDGILDQIQEWQAEKNTRHNRFANSQAHKYFIRREIEKKLSLTYEMDPTNYASYGAYFLFLSESSLSDRSESVRLALTLGENTVRHCLHRQDDIQALLTGAAASHDLVQLLINNGDEQARVIAGQYSELAGEFLDGFEHRALEMAFDGTWENFSELRRSEMTDRARLLRKLIEADKQTPGINAGNSGSETERSAG